MSNINIEFYNQQADQLSPQYNGLKFEEVHAEWLKHIQLPSSGSALDIGCGSGRDAKALANLGLSVVAVDPAEELLKTAKETNNAPNITWLQDQLPALSNLFKLDMKFDLILVSAVWMHIPSSERERSFRKLTKLLNPSGRLAITLRHGPSPDTRVMYEVSKDEILKLASSQGLIKKIETDCEQDQLKRSEVSWETLAFELPDDGTGAFPLLRNIVVNDNKSSTYKLGLLRCLIRIAEGHPGAVLNREEGMVELPLGLVAFYWVKIYQKLVDHSNLQQNSNSNKGLGFITDSGWRKLSLLGCENFQLGDIYADKDKASAINTTLREAAQTIRSMPSKYITIPNTKDQVFEVEYRRGSRLNSLLLDSEYLASLGSFYVPLNIWDNLTQYSTWIEPAIINEWALLLLTYKHNQANKFDRQYCLEALNWDEATRSTTRIRNRVEELQKTESVYCCWSAKNLNPTTKYAIDHCFPFARWPNNDLWNLLPTKAQINLQKSDRLPSAQKLSHSKETIIHWWQMAWENEQSEFFTQANLSLPQLGINNDNFEDVFESLMLQRARLREIQQLQEW